MYLSTQGQQQLTHSSGTGGFQALSHNCLSILCRPALQLQDWILVQEWKSSRPACLVSPAGDMSAGAGHTSAGCMLRPAGNDSWQCRFHSQLQGAAAVAALPEAAAPAAGLARLPEAAGPKCCSWRPTQPPACGAGQVSS